MTSPAHRGVPSVLAALCVGICVGTCVGLSACAPALDWRDVRPAGTDAVAQFPCKPATQERPVVLAGRPVRLALYACSAEDQTWGLASADIADPAAVGPALRQLRAAALNNIGAAGGQALPLPLRVPGATPNENSGRVGAAGKSPDGTALQMQVAVFAHGTRVYQATVLGARVGAEAADTYFAALRLGP